MNEKRYLLTVVVEPRVFEAYWYGVGTVVVERAQEDDVRVRYVVDYGDDEYRARYQADRFWSGLYPASVICR